MDFGPWGVAVPLFSNSSDSVIVLFPRATFSLQLNIDRMSGTHSRGMPGCNCCGWRHTRLQGHVRTDSRALSRSGTTDRKSHTIYVPYLLNPPRMGLSNQLKMSREGRERIRGAIVERVWQERLLSRVLHVAVLWPSIFCRTCFAIPE